MPKGNPQLNDGYTKIANELLEAVIGGSFTLQETKILLAVIRQTYGYNRKEAEISTRLFETITRINRRNIQKVLMGRFAKGVLSRHEGRDMRFGQPVYKYVLNKVSVCKIYATPGVKYTPPKGVEYTPIKERNKILNKRRVETVDKLSFPK